MKLLKSSFISTKIIKKTLLQLASVHLILFPLTLILAQYVDYKDQLILGLVLFTIALYLMFKEMNLSNLQTEIYKALFKNNINSTFLIDMEGNVIDVNDSASRIFGYKKEEMINVSITTYIHPEYLKQTLTHFHILLSGKPISTKTKILHKEGHYLDIEMSSSPIIFNKKVVGVIGISVDKTKERLLEEKLNKLAKLDGLTNIPNRRSFDNYLAETWNIGKTDGYPITLFMIDLDYFKKYNDEYGHLQADQSLILVAKQIELFVKKYNGFCARFGGEEFSIILSNYNKETSLKIAEQIRKEIENLAIPHSNSDISEVLTISIGVSALVPNNTNSSYELVDKADKALYQSKRRGRNCVTYID